MLVAILYLQFGRGGEKPVGEAVELSTAAAGGGGATGELVGKPGDAGIGEDAGEQSAEQGKDAAAAPLIDETRWKSPKLETIVAYDPFALPPTFPQPPKVAAGAKGKDGEALIAAAAADDAKKLAEAVEKLHMELEELTQRGVHVIVREGDQYVAMDRRSHAACGRQDQRLHRHGDRSRWCAY